MAKTGESSQLRDEEFRDIHAVCQESPIVAEPVVVVEPIPLVTVEAMEFESALNFEEQFNESEDELEENSKKAPYEDATEKGKLLDGMLNQNIELGNKVSRLENHIQELQAQVVKHQQELELELEKEVEKRKLVQAWARALVQNTEKENKIQELEATIRDLQNKNQMKNEEIEKVVISNKERSVDREKKTKESRTGEDSIESSHNFKRKWNKDKLKQVESQPKKKKMGTCMNCGKSHWGVCLKGKKVCFRCGQNGHIAPNCPKPMEKQGCFRCGAADHHIKVCPKKKIVRRKLESVPAGGN